MTPSRHDLLRLLESLRSTDGLELVRGVGGQTLQKQAEAEAHIGAEWNEHTQTRTALRNGQPRQDAHHPSRRPGPRDPQAAVEEFLPRAAGAAPHRPGPVRRHHGGLRPRRVHTVGRPGQSPRRVHRDIQERSLAETHQLLEDVDSAVDVLPWCPTALAPTCGRSTSRPYPLHARPAAARSTRARRTCSKVAP